jgi:hypothetical protein
MAHLSLPGSHLFEGVDFSANARLRSLIEAASNPVVLFPAEGAKALEALSCEAAPPTLIVLDGTWSQARKLWKLNPFLHGLPAYRLTPRQPSRYRVRAEPAAHCVSTIEAVAAALQILDCGVDRDREAMLAPFLDLVDRQANFGERPDRSPRRRFRDRPKSRSLPDLLQRVRSDALFIHVESNGFPKRMRDRPPGELVQLAAQRLRDGATFDALTWPRHRGPHFQELGLSPEAEASASSNDDLRARFAAFEQPRDVWAIWGRFPLDLMRGAGIVVPDERAVLDLKHACANLLARNPGTLEHASDELGIGEVPTHLTRRADQKLWRMARVFDRLTRG